MSSIYLILAASFSQQASRGPVCIWWLLILDVAFDSSSQLFCKPARSNRLYTNEWETRQCCPGNILDGIRTHSISSRDLFVGDLIRTLQAFSHVLLPLRPRVSGDCLGIWKLIPSGISTLLVLRLATITTQYF